MIVTFCGHSDVDDSETLRKWLEDVIETLVAQGATQFYCGGYGGFDRMVSGVLRNVKKDAPHIQSILVLAYLSHNPYAQDYDSTLYPELETVPKRYAILKRNQWMVRNSDTVVAYVTHGWGGAAKTLTYAISQKKRIICYPAKP